MESFLTAWLLAFCRASCAFLFLQLPSARRTPPATRVLFALLISALIAPVWELRLFPHADSLSVLLATTSLPAYLLRELLTGLCFGLTWTALLEIYSFGMQMISIQAGFSYASMIDPTSEADSGLLLVIGQFVGLLALLGMGYHLEFLHAFLGTVPTFGPAPQLTLAGATELATRLMREVTHFALRISLPLISFLVILDIVFVLLGKFNEKLQLISLSLGLKTLAALLLIAVSLPSLASISASGIRRIEQHWTREAIQLVR